MKNKKLITRISTGIAALIISLTLAQTALKKDEYSPRINLSSSSKLENYIDTYQELFGTNQDLQLNDYDYYLDAYYDYLNEEHYNPITRKYTVNFFDKEKFEYEKKKKEDGKIIYYNDVPYPDNGIGKIIDNNRVTIYYYGKNNITMSLDENENIIIEIKYSAGGNSKIIINKDKSYSITVDSMKYSFDQNGILKDSLYTKYDNNIRRVYDNGNLQLYKEYNKGILSKICREDGTRQEIYEKILSSEIQEKLSFYKIEDYFDKIYVEYDKEDNITSIEYKTNTQQEDSYALMKQDGSFTSSIKYKNSDSKITYEKKTICDDKGIIKEIENDIENDTIKKTIYDKDGNVELLTIDGIIREEFKENKRTFYYSDSSIEKYYIYDNNGYTEYDSNNIKVRYYNNNGSTTEYYEDGTKKSYTTKKEAFTYYPSGKIESYKNNSNEDSTITVENNKYTIKANGYISFYETGKIKEIEKHTTDEHIIKTYYETSELKSIEDLYNNNYYQYRKDGTRRVYIENGEGKSFYDDGKIHEIYSNNKVVKSYYANGKIEYEKKGEVETSYYENGNKKSEINQSNYQKEYNENGILTFYSKAGYYEKYDDEGILIEKEDNCLRTEYKDGKIIRYTYCSWGENQKKSIEINDTKYVLSNGESITLYENGNIDTIERNNNKTKYYETGEVNLILNNSCGKSFYKSGKVFEIIEDDKVVKSFYESGKLKSELIDNELREYYESGALYKISVNSTLIESYYENGNISYTNKNGEERYISEDGVVTSELINGVRYNYYSNGDLYSITENGVTTRYKDDEVYSVSEDNHEIIYPIPENHNFYIDRYYDFIQESTSSESTLFKECRYIYNDKEIYRSKDNEFYNYDYDPEYGITQILIRSEEDNEIYSIYVNDNYYRNAK